MTPTIRPAVQKDIDDLLKLIKQLFTIEKDFHFDEVKQREGLFLLLESDNSCVLVAEHDAHVIGMCTVQTLISTAEGGRVGLVEDMVIDGKWKGQGLGKQILLAIEHWSITNGLKRLQLLADIDNTSALGFYHSLNWSKTNLIALRKNEFNN